EVQRDLPIEGDLLELERGQVVELGVAEAEGGGVLGDQGQRQDFWDVLARLLGEVLAQRPVVPGAGLLEQASHAAASGVVAGERQVPVPELTMELREEAGGGPGGLAGIPSLI